MRKFALLFVLAAVAACGGGGGPDVDSELKKRGFNIVSCQERGEERFSCLLRSGRLIEVFVHEGKVLVLRPV